MFFLSNLRSFFHWEVLPALQSQFEDGQSLLEFLLEGLIGGDQPLNPLCHIGAVLVHVTELSQVSWKGEEKAERIYGEDGMEKKWRRTGEEEKKKGVTHLVTPHTFSGRVTLPHTHARAHTHTHRQQRTQVASHALYSWKQPTTCATVGIAAGSQRDELHETLHLCDWRVQIRPQGHRQVERSYTGTSSYIYIYPYITLFSYSMATEFACLMKPMIDRMLHWTANRPGVRWLNCSQKSLIYAAEQYKLDLKDRNKESVRTYTGTSSY